MNVNDIKQKKMKNHIIILFIVAFLFTPDIHAQIRNDIDLKIRKKDFRTGQVEGLAEAWESVLVGDDYFKAGLGTYDLARDHYLFAYQYNPANSILNFKLGIAYLFTDDKYEALKYLRAAYDKAPDLHPEIRFYLGRAYHLVLEFDKAKDYYRDQRNIYVKMGDVESVMVIDKLLNECENGKKLIASPRRVIIMNMGGNINSIADDYNGIFTNGDSLLYFTSRRKETKKDKRNPYDNKFYENIYSSRLSSAGWSKAARLEKPLNRKGNDALVGISPEDQTLYIYRGKENGGDIFYSDFNVKKKNWKKPKRMSSKILSKDEEGSVFQTITGDTLYFISANRKLTKGGKDIFYTVKNHKGKWQKPQNIGSLLNTPYDEEGLFLTPDGKEMYFSSKGHNSMGGFDVFHTVKLDDGTWSDPVNLGFPINTPEDEVFFTLANDGRTAHFSTIRENVVGRRDLYKLVFLGAEKEMLLSTEDILVAGIQDTSKTGFFRIPELMVIDNFYKLTGRVLDKKSGEPIFAKLNFIDIDNSRPPTTTISSDSGVYNVRFTEAKNYGVEILAKDYMFFLDVVDMSLADTDRTDTVDFLLDKVEVGAKVVLENIYFEVDKATLMPDSYQQLNQVAAFMENNEAIRMEISGHTDNTGSQSYNTKLSERRAKAVVDYLTGHGINASRLEWKGYAFSQPIAPNDTAAGREKNRRVEFKILSM